MPLPDKARVHAALLTELRKSLEVIAHAAQDAAAGATHEENRSEGDKDMRATEQSYIARGQAMRAEDLAEQIQRLEGWAVRSRRPDAPIEAGALIQLEVDGEPRLHYLIAHGGGTELEVDGAKITVITPASPLGRALLGRTEGDDLELRIRGAIRECVIVSIA